VPLADASTTPCLRTKDRGDGFVMVGLEIWAVNEREIRNTIALNLV
jgi:hypothetical protein